MGKFRISVIQEILWIVQYQFHKQDNILRNTAINKRVSQIWICAWGFFLDILPENNCENLWRSKNIFVDKNVDNLELEQIVNLNMSELAHI